MATENIVFAVSERLFADGDMQVFAVLDGASIPDLRMNLYKLQPEHVCLYRGELEDDMAEVAPYLVRLEEDGEFTNWMLTQGWGEHWGIVAQTPSDLQALRQHFRRFLTVYGPENKPLLFRYYDPRVLRVYLPTCAAEELATVFGPVRSFLCEDEDPNTALRFRVVSGALRQEKIKLT
ncbi:MAG: DUF4123 domain-containing protein [Candidatus Binatia bacterium]